MEIDLSNEQKNNIMNIARSVISHELGIAKNYNIYDDPFLSEKLGAFVTIHIDKSLRGCIGYIVGHVELKEAIRELAISSAFRDPRFPPLTVDEFFKIDIEISILSPIESVKNISDIVIGKDGLIIKKGWNSGLLLPQVAVEQKWNVDEFLKHTCLKAGLPPNAYKEMDVIIEKFSAYVFGETI